MTTDNPGAGTPAPTSAPEPPSPGRGGIPTPADTEPLHREISSRAEDAGFSLSPAWVQLFGIMVNLAAEVMKERPWEPRQPSSTKPPKTRNE